MRLNDLHPKHGSRRPAKRVGRGASAGGGKTAGRGVKGQHARAGGFHKVGFEGGQMPLQRRLPKFGFKSLQANLTAEVRLHELDKIEAEAVDLAALKQAGVVPVQTLQAKVIASGRVSRAVKLRGIGVTPGARKAIEAAGGSIE